MGGLPNEPIPDPHVPLTERLQIGDHILSTKYGVVERPDHHCDDDFESLSWLQKRFRQPIRPLARPSSDTDTMINTALGAIVSLSSKIRCHTNINGGALAQWVA